MSPMAEATTANQRIGGSAFSTMSMISAVKRVALA